MPLGNLDQKAIEQLNRKGCLKSILVQLGIVIGTVLLLTLLLMLMTKLYGTD